jgi:hypothetical protein
MIAQLRRLTAVLLVGSMSAMGMPQPAQAGMIDTGSAVAAADRAHIAGLLDRSEVRAQLEAWGVSLADAKARVAALDDAEAARLAGEIDSLPAGGDGVSALIGAVVLVFLVLLITDLLGLTKIFPFTRSVR